MTRTAATVTYDGPRPARRANDYGLQVRAARQTSRAEYGARRHEVMM